MTPSDISADNYQDLLRNLHGVNPTSKASFAQSLEGIPGGSTKMVGNFTFQRGLGFQDRPGRLAVRVRSGRYSYDHAVSDEVALGLAFGLLAVKGRSTGRGRRAIYVIPR